jgi:hypothetical protein
VVPPVVVVVVAWWLRGRGRVVAWSGEWPWSRSSLSRKTMLRFHPDRLCAHGTRKTYDVVSLAFVLVLAVSNRCELLS